MSKQWPLGAHLRFLQGISSTEENGCIEWPFSRTKRGYGRINYKGQSIHAHRVSYELSRNQEPGALLVCHKCDNRPCVNPRHLFLGTHLDNMRDCKNKGRTLRGASHPATKLTEQDAKEIKALRPQGVLLRIIAGKFKVSITVVSRIGLGKTWAFLK